MYLIFLPLIYSPFISHFLIYSQIGILMLHIPHINICNDFLHLVLTTDNTKQPSGLEVIQLDYNLKLKIKRKQPIIALYFEFENELKVNNLEVWS